MKYKSVTHKHAMTTKQALEIKSSLKLMLILEFSHRKSSNLDEAKLKHLGK